VPQQPRHPHSERSRCEHVLELASEFGAVTVAVDNEANGPRLRIENLQNGRAIYLDPLELASLTWLEHERLGPFLDPSQTGWRSDTGA
jgi:hypothetical protein